MPTLASRMARLGRETAFDALTRVQAMEAAGHSVVRLGIGEPDFPTPQGVVAAAREAMDRGYTRYTPPEGLPAVREAVAASMEKRLSVPVRPDRVILTPGAKPVLFYTVMALCDEGDEVILPDPGFPIYESVVRFAGAVPVRMRLREELGFAPDPDELRRSFSARTRLVLLNSPGNPCGNVLPARTLSDIASLVLEGEAVVLSDEIYHEFHYDAEAPSIATLPGMMERTVVLDGLSKSHAMTGWRLEYAAVPEGLVEPLARLVTNTVSCAAAFSQMAAIEALTGTREPLDRMVAEFRARRDLLVEGLNQLPGIRCAMPQGAFYAFPRVTETGLDSATFERRALEEARVALLAGTSFGPGGEGFVRISFASGRDQLSEGLSRLEVFLSDL